VRHLDNFLRSLDRSASESDSDFSSETSYLLGPPSPFATFSTRPSAQSLPFDPRLTPFVEIPPENVRSDAAKNQISSDLKSLPKITPYSQSTNNDQDTPRDLKCHKLLSYFMLTAIFIAYLLQLFLVSH